MTSMRAHLFVAACLLGACSAPPKRDVFIPPYAEKGCWAQFYEQADFGPPMRQVEGPMFVEAIAGSIVLVPDLERIPPRPLFDIIVFDEASQCRLEEALPVLLRAQQVPRPAQLQIQRRDSEAGPPNWGTVSGSYRLNRLARERHRAPGAKNREAPNSRRLLGIFAELRTPATSS